MSMDSSVKHYVCADDLAIVAQFWNNKCELSKTLEFTGNYYIQGHQHDQPGLFTYEYSIHEISRLIKLIVTWEGEKLTDCSKPTYLSVLHIEH